MVLVGLAHQEFQKDPLAQEVQVALDYQRTQCLLLNQMVQWVPMVQGVHLGQGNLEIHSDQLVRSVPKVPAGRTDPVARCIQTLQVLPGVRTIQVLLKAHSIRLLLLHQLLLVLPG